MTESDRELNELLAKRLLADVAAVATLQQHFDQSRTISGAYRGAGAAAGSAGYVRS
jgi:hypothetical protein